MSRFNYGARFTPLSTVSSGERR